MRKLSERMRERTGITRDVAGSRHDITCEACLKCVSWTIPAALFLRPFKPQFGLKIRGSGPPSPSPTSATELGSQFLTPWNISVSAKDVCILPYNGNSVVLSIAASVKLIGPPAVQRSTPAQQPVRIASNHRLQKLAQITDIAITDG